MRLQLNACLYLDHGPHSALAFRFIDCFDCLFTGKGCCEVLAFPQDFAVLRILCNYLPQCLLRLVHYHPFLKGEETIVGKYHHHYGLPKVKPRHILQNLDNGFWLDDGVLGRDYFTANALACVLQHGSLHTVQVPAPAGSGGMPQPSLGIFTQQNERHLPNLKGMERFHICPSHLLLQLSHDALHPGVAHIPALVEANHSDNNNVLTG